MAIISTETKASTASPGNNKGPSFNLSNQWETYQRLPEDHNALLIKAEQFAVYHKISSLFPKLYIYTTDHSKTNTAHSLKLEQIMSYQKQP